MCVAGSATARGYSSAGKVATSASAARDPAVHAVQRREPEAPARLVELAAPALEARVGQRATARPTARRPTAVRGSRAPTE